jgi:ferritin-like metal-binding protein YciE
LIAAQAGLQNASSRDGKPRKATGAGVQTDRLSNQRRRLSGKEVVGEVDKKSVLDAAPFAAAQAVEHYEMTRYGKLVAWAKQLNRDDCATLFQQTLDEEKATDKKLTANRRSN